MAHIVLCVRHGDSIYDYATFSRNLAPVQFEDSTVGLAMRRDPCWNMSQYFVIRCTPVVVETRESQTKPKHLYRQSSKAQLTSPSNSTSKDSHSNNSSSNHGNSKNQMGGGNNPPEIVNQLSLIQLQVAYRTCVLFPSNLAYCSYKETLRSKRFRKYFVNYIKRNHRYTDVRDKVCRCEELFKICDLSITLPWLIEVCLQPTPAQIGYSWCYRLLVLVQKKLHLEETMAWLSTLGGGYSSLGDYFTHFSEEAGRISVTQHKIAMEMGDPIMASKCRLFYSLSLMQRSCLRASKYIIRGEYIFARRCKIQDQRLLDMCQGIWSKLQYLYATRKRSKCQNTSNGYHGSAMTFDLKSNSSHS